MDVELQFILDVAERFRGALNAIGYDRPSCDFASWMLAIYLQDKEGIGGFVVRTANRENSDGRHCWLVGDDLHVDITADQFGKRPVIVERNSEWHGRLPFIEDRVVQRRWIFESDYLADLYQRAVQTLG